MLNDAGPAYLSDMLQQYEPDTRLILTKVKTKQGGTRFSYYAALNGTNRKRTFEEPLHFEQTSNLAFVYETYYINKFALPCLKVV